MDFILYYISNYSIHTLNISQLLQTGMSSQDLDLKYKIKISKMKKGSPRQSNGYFINKDECQEYLNDMILLEQSSFQNINNKYVCKNCGHSYNYLSDLKSVNYKCTKCEIHHNQQILQQHNLLYINSNKVQCGVCSNFIGKNFKELQQCNFECYHCEDKEVKKDTIIELNNHLSQFNLVVLDTPDNIDFQNINIKCQIHDHNLTSSKGGLTNLKHTLCPFCKIDEVQSIIDDQDLNFTVMEYNKFNNIMVKCNVCGTVIRSHINSIANGSLKCQSQTCRKLNFTKYYKDKHSLPEYLTITGYGDGEYHFHCQKCDSEFVAYNGNIHKCFNCEKSTSSLERILINWLDSEPLLKDINYNVRYRVRATKDEDSKIIHYTKEENKIYRKISDTNLEKISISELDFYFPQHNFAIEVNGLAFHTVPNVFGVFHKWNHKMHYVKYNRCKKLGIHLLQLNDLDFNKLELLKSMIVNKLKVTPNKIYARKCVIKPVGTKEAKLFLDTNHIQGFTGAKYKVGLYHNDELVAYMSINRKGELNRFCQLQYNNVIGGFSKLFKHMIKLGSFDSVHSFSDNMYSYGDVYEKNGFVIDEVQAISYKYYHHNQAKKKLEHCKNYRIRKIEKNPDLVYEEKKTEKELMEMNGYSRYYDAGKIKWVYKINT